MAKGNISDIRALSETVNKRRAGGGSGSGRGAKTPENTENMVIEVLKTEAFKKEVERCVPEGVTYDVDRLLRVVQTQIRNDVKLASCEPLTILGAVMECAQMGLMPGFMGHVFISTNETMTPGGFQFEAQVIPGYKGLISLARRGGEISSITARTVTDKEIDAGLFELYFEGEKDTLIHRPILKGERGKVVLVYCLIRFRDGTFLPEVMLEEDINQIKFEAMRRLGAGGSESAWVKFEMEMWRKTVIRRAIKYLDVSVDGLGRAVSLDEKFSVGESQDLGSEMRSDYGLPSHKQEEKQPVAEATGTTDGMPEQVNESNGDQPEAKQLDPDDPSAGSII